MHRMKVPSWVTARASRQLKNLVRTIMGRRVPAGARLGFGLSFLQQGELLTQEQILSDQSRIGLTRCCNLCMLRRLSIGEIRSLV